MLTTATRRGQLRRILMDVKEETRPRVKDDVEFLELALGTDTVKKMIKEEHALMTCDDKFLKERIVREIRIKIKGAELAATTVTSILFIDASDINN